MRRRAGDMRDARRAEPVEETLDRLVDAGKPQRALAGERAQENLQAAVAANVVERRPLLQGRRARWRRRAWPAYGRRASAARWCPRSAAPIRSPDAAARFAAGRQRQAHRQRRDQAQRGGRRRPRHRRARRPRRARRRGRSCPPPSPAGTERMRRATPSRSISAAAALAMSRTASTTLRPAKRSGRRRTAEPAAKSAQRQDDGRASRSRRVAGAARARSSAKR